MLTNNWIALAITLFIAIAWLRLMDFFAHRGLISNRLSRKIIHIGTGPIYVMCWVLFTDAPEARYLAALVPGLITIQFILVGFGIIKDEAAVQAMSRSGNPREILRGPLYYGILFVLLTILFWTDNPIGIIALMILSGGDGLADILGRRFGKHRLFWNKDKSWIGSLGMFTGGWLFSLAISLYFVAFSIFPPPFSAYILPITIIALVCTLIESLPIHDLDNITITAAAVLCGYLVF
jgi:phytol kinase